VRKTNWRRLASSLLGTAAALLATAPAVGAPVPGTAASPLAVVQQGDAVASAGPLVLEPTDRGYRGHLLVTVRNTGTSASYFNLLIREPVAGSFRGAQPTTMCQRSVEHPGHRTTNECFLPTIQPGAELTVDVEFAVLTTPRDYAMRALGGGLAVSGSYPPSYSDFADFQATFRSTTGSVLGARLYQQDKLAESSVTVAGDLTLTRTTDGSFVGRVRATVRYGTDAAHDYLWLTTAAPGNVSLTATDPVEVPCYTNCEVPGGKFVEGEERSFDLVFEAPSDTPVGPLGEVTADVSTYWQHDVVNEADLSDNTVTFQVHATEAA